VAILLTRFGCAIIMSEPPGVSIIVVNYNNEGFLAAAIDSALGQTHPSCEVIVVDDCSTDNSRAVIARYGDNIKSVLRETNVGQIAATNGAWPLARYPILMFLDSDDLLFPHAAASVAGIWLGTTVKAQCCLAIIDKAGRRLGPVTPKYPPNLDTGTIRSEILRTGGSPNSPGSGNAYSRSLLEHIRDDGGFELQYPRDISMDTILECNAPFYGDVVTIYDALACYRIHDNNDSLQNTISKNRFDKMSRYFACKLDYLVRRCLIWGVSFDPVAARNCSIWSLECRLISDKLRGDGDPPGEPVWRILCRALNACINARLPLSNRVIRALWFVSVAVSPQIIAKRLIALRFVISERPAWFERCLTAVANISGGRGSARVRRHRGFGL
jgi:glycosyltransferase involved in cell wall biosynthesis